MFDFIRLIIFTLASVDRFSLIAGPMAVMRFIYATDDPNVSTIG